MTQSNVQGNQLQDAVVLVVDDDPDLRALVQQTLGGAGLTLHCVDNGEDALAVAASIRPDLIITDVLMPGLDGWALVRRLRSLPATALTPVILMTALTSRGHHLRGFRLGADDYLPKPFEPEELILRVQRVLASPPELSTPSDSDLDGRLDQICLSSILTLLDNDQKSGTLTVETADQTCRMELNAGSIATATVGDSLVAEEAMYEVLSWPSGDFCFREHDVETAPLGVNTIAFLLEAARRVDEAGNSGQSLPAMLN